MKLQVSVRRRWFDAIVAIVIAALSAAPMATLHGDLVDDPACLPSFVGDSSGALAIAGESGQTDRADHCHACHAARGMSHQLQPAGPVHALDSPARAPLRARDGADTAFLHAGVPARSPPARLLLG